MHTRQRPAAVLLLSLLLMASISASTIALSVLMASTYKQSVDQDRFLAAGLAADTGMERSLAVITAGRSKESLDRTLTTAMVTGISVSPGGARYSVTATTQSATVPTTLQPGQTQSIDLLRNGVTTLADHLEIRGTPCVSPDLNVTCGGTIQVAWSVVTDAGLSNYVGRKFITGIQYNNTGAIVDLTCVYTDVNNTGCTTVPGTVIGYRVTLTALTLPVRSITSRPCNTSGGICSTYTDASGIVLNVTGNQGQAQATKQAQVLWQLPSSGVFNFVIFTEGSIVPPS